mmetsp:Transcript_7683/g.25238  ORF Transcript_7683/g.25238 Transcript_7683/m.25238 type:complete len:244 (-) Transcript_7683:20-751(-)
MGTSRRGTTRRSRGARSKRVKRGRPRRSGRRGGTAHDRREIGRARRGGGAARRRRAFFASTTALEDEVVRRPARFQGFGGGVEARPGQGAAHLEPNAFDHRPQTSTAVRRSCRVPRNQEVRVTTAARRARRSRRRPREKETRATATRGAPRRTRVASASRSRTETPRAAGRRRLEQCFGPSQGRRADAMQPRGPAQMQGGAMCGPSEAVGGRRAPSRRRCPTSQSVSRPRASTPPAHLSSARP